MEYQLHYFFVYSEHFKSSHSVNLPLITHYDGIFKASQSLHWLILCILIPYVFNSQT